MRAESIRLTKHPKCSGTDGHLRTKLPRDLTSSDRMGDRCHSVHEQALGLAADWVAFSVVACRDYAYLALCRGISMPRSEASVHKCSRRRLPASA